MTSFKTSFSFLFTYTHSVCRFITVLQVLVHTVRTERTVIKMYIYIYIGDLQPWLQILVESTWNFSVCAYCRPGNWLIRRATYCATLSELARKRAGWLYIVK
jgi:hypothetical protein